MRGRISILISFISVCVSAQNLVPNPSFEEVAKCPQSFYVKSEDFLIPGWTSASLGTPDLFHACGGDDAGVPFNWAGESNAHSGKGYAGIFVWDSDVTLNNREYLQCELSEPLKGGDKYKVDFYYKLAPSSVYAINRIGLTLSETPFNLQHDKLIGQTPVLSVEKPEIKVGNTGDWEHATLIYRAKGGERHVIIGNFFSNEETKNKRLPWRFGKNDRLGFKSYYFIDDVSVKPIDSLKQNVVSKASKLRPGTIALNTDYILDGIQFEFDTYVLERSSFVELDKVVEYLKQHPEVSVRLSGYADFVGPDDYNLNLSRDRARSVANHFISRGIPSQRIISYGFGKIKPITLEKTDEARKINRRVEIRFVTEPAR